jgi:malic enzyme
MLAAGISVGKLDLYVAAGGFHPSRVMPVVVDVGTDNETLLNEPLYMGLKRKRMRGREFVELMDEIVTALTQRYPTAVLQFEDFAIDRAKPLLERYRYDHLVFNDDIQVCFIIFGKTNRYSQIFSQKNLVKKSTNNAPTWCRCSLSSIHTHSLSTGTDRGAYV